MSASSDQIVTILVVERDVAIRTALADLLEGEGYRVVEAETLFEAEPLIDNSHEPMVLVVGDGDGIAHDSLHFFSAIAANPVTRHAYLYLTTAPRRERLPRLVKALAALADPTIDRPYELASFLAVVAHAAEQIRG